MKTYINDDGSVEKTFYDDSTGLMQVKKETDGSGGIEQNIRDINATDERYRSQTLNPLARNPVAIAEH